MFKNRILKKLGAGLMAGLCAFTLIGTNLSSFKTSAAETAKEPLLSGDEVIRAGCNLSGRSIRLGLQGLRRRLFVLKS